MRTGAHQQASVSVPSEKPIRGYLLLLFTLAIIASVLRTGYRDIKGGNHPLQLVLVQKIHEPTLYPNDSFVEQTAFAYGSVLWYGVAHASLVVDLRVLLLGLFLLNRVLYAWAFYQLGRVFFPDSRYAFVGALVFFAFAPTSVLGEGDPFRDSAEQTGLAVACALLALVALIQKRYRWVALWLGLTINLNLMYGIYTLSYLTACFLFVGAYRKAWKQIVGAVLLGCVIGLPAFVLVGRSAAHPIGNEVAVWQATEILFPFHFYPDASSPKKHLVYWCLVLLSSVICVYLGRRMGNHLAWRSLLVWSGVAVGIYLLGWAVPYLFQLLPLLLPHPLRASDIWLLLTGAVLCGGISEVLHQRAKRRNGFITAGLFAIALIHGFSEHAERVRRAGAWHGIPFTACDKIAVWAVHGTPREAVFLIPITPTDEWIHFRHLSRRNVFTQWKDGSACTYAPWYAAEWLNRLYLLGFAEVAGVSPETYRIGRWVSLGKEFIPLYRRVDEQVSQAHVEQIVQRGYRIDYWVLPEHKPTAFPIVYRVDGWKVVRVIPKEGGVSERFRR
mgnify:CR=1 FL=1